MTEYQCDACEDGENLVEGYQCWHCGRYRPKTR